jgi:hypothetical protein
VTTGLKIAMSPLPVRNRSAAATSSSYRKFFEPQYRMTSVRLKHKQIQLVALSIVVKFVFGTGNCLVDQHFFEEGH